MARTLEDLQKKANKSTKTKQKKEPKPKRSRQPINKENNKKENIKEATNISDKISDVLMLDKASELKDKISINKENLTPSTSNEPNDSSQDTFLETIDDIIAQENINLNNLTENDKMTVLRFMQSNINNVEEFANYTKNNGEKMADLIISINEALKHE